MAGIGLFDQRGVSLTETLVALAILGLVVAVFLGGIYTSTIGNGIAATRISAESLARSELEYVRASVYDNVTGSYTLPGTPPSWDPSHSTLPSGSDYFSVTVDTEDMAGYGGGMKKITAIAYLKGNEVLRIVTYKTR
ncbi:MAG: prepilin-type N-terminal cleavage/methylation domain-containing protein [Dehalococcoidia bacterium]|nr:prepilin-type N-terminal cleavage/methylation domain-containing protein [Dehalococcoidia bacterium]MDD5493148.1 prepilin-type N-terminal cleavage/methylation domain-containing protein [Dehalococcoidia bacterium]